MNPHRWAAVKDLFAEVATLGPEEREAFLRNLAQAEPEISAMLRELLANTPASAPDLRNPCWLPSPPASPSSTLLPGQRLLNRFEIREFIGAGGLGEVYRAWDLQQEIEIALKTLRASLVSDAAAIQGLRRELNTARAVTHACVCRLYDFHPQADRSSPPFVTMELLSGETLSQYLSRTGPLPLPRARQLAAQILDGLEAAHSAGIVHRDLKAANVMLTRDGSRAHITDFGLARDFNPGQNLESTLAGSSFAGTPAYMAPEQLRGSRATFASDIYALGVLLFELVTARRPFEGATAVDIASRRLHEAAPSPRKYNPKVNRAWEYTVLQCLEADPARRPPSVAAVRRLLESPPPLFWKRRRLMVALLVPPAVGAGAWFFAPDSVPVEVKVFDFENATGDPALDYVCRSTTAELLRRLTQLRHCNVFPARGIRRLAPADSRAPYLLDGGLQSDRGNLQLHIQLTDGRTGRLLWSRSYDRRRLDNLLATQTEIAQGAAAALESHIRSAGLTRLAGWSGFWTFNTSWALAPTQSSLAFDSYLRGASLLQEGSPASIDAGADLLRRAVEEDPHFALALAALSEAALIRLNFSHTFDVALVALARDYAERAVREQPALAEAHAVRAATRQLDWDWNGAEASYKEALRLKPTFPRAHRWRGGLLLQFARFDEALAEMTLAYEQDPYDRSGVSVHGLTLLFAGRLQEAAVFLEKSIGDRDMATSRFNLCQVYARQGTLAAGAEAARFFDLALAATAALARIEARSASNDSQLSTWMFALIHALRGAPADAETFIRQLEETVARLGTSPSWLSAIYAALGKTGPALDAIERAIDLRDRFVLYLRVNVFLDPLRKEPRFDAALRRVRLI